MTQLRPEDIKTLYKIVSMDAKTAAEFHRALSQSRCEKCLYGGGYMCKGLDLYGRCIKYKRDPPDGGYYG